MIEARRNEVDGYMQNAKVTLGGVSDFDLQLARVICDYFDLKWGTLLRRARAIELAGGQDSFAECLQEAAQHLVLSE